MAKKKRNSWEVITERTKREAVRRVLSGETRTDVAEDVGVNIGTVGNWMKKYGEEESAVQPVLTPERVKTIGTLADFVKRVRSILWRKDQAEYNRWIERVGQYQDLGYELAEAQVEAAKEYHVLRPIFREYDIRRYDRNPDNHPEIIWFGEIPQLQREIKNLNIEQPYRDNMRWAACQAGLHLRTGVEPVEIPNDTAYYLYQQALGDPKDFMTKLGQLEGREDQEAMLEKTTRKATERSVKEIDKWLSEIDEDDPRANAQAKGVFRKEDEEEEYLPRPPH